MNIIWQRPDGGISVTLLTDEAVSVEHEAQKLSSRGDVPSDWVMVATNIPLPESGRKWREAWCWETSEPVIDINKDKACEITKESLRQRRLPLMAALDVDFIRSLEEGSSTAAIIEEKNRLRDITKQVTPDKSLDELMGISL